MVHQVLSRANQFIALSSTLCLTYKRHGSLKLLLVTKLIQLLKTSSRNLSWIQLLYFQSTTVICFANRIWVGADKTMQQHIIVAFHDSPVGGHSGFQVTYWRISSLFKWTGMKSAVEVFVRHFRVCQRAKPEHVLAPGLLQPLPIPSGP
jgi:hypothetical protein